jgi:hypothetical protein
MGANGTGAGSTRLHVAVGAVMQHLGVDVFEAYRWIAERSSRTGVAIGEVVEEILRSIGDDGHRG